jgi:hypothetical protein
MIAPIRKVISAHDRDRLPAHLVELIDCRCQPQGARTTQHAKQCDADSAQHLQESRALGRKRAANPLQKIQQEAVASSGGRLPAVHAQYFLHQAGIGFRHAHKRGFCRWRREPPHQLLEQPGTNRIERGHAAEVDRPDLRR